MRTAEAAMLKVARMLPKGSTILDVGAGNKAHADWFKSKGYKVVTTDLNPLTDHYGDFNDIWPNILSMRGQFDCVWCSHVLEHQQNTGRFIKAIAQLAKPNGLIAITVPPLKETLVGGHLSLYTPLSLLYNLVMAEIDCSGAALKVEGYNISVLVKNRKANMPWELTYDRGDIERLSHLFPVQVEQGAEGFSLQEVNW